MHSFTQWRHMTLTVIFKVIGIGYNTFSADYMRVIFVRICPRTYYFLNSHWMKMDRWFTWEKYLKTLNSINTKNIMFKINPFLSPRISPTNTKLNDLEIQSQGHYLLMTLENYFINYLWFIINTRVQESVYLQFYTTLTLPTIVHLQQL